VSLIMASRLSLLRFVKPAAETPITPMLAPMIAAKTSITACLRQISTVDSLMGYSSRVFDFKNNDSIIVT
jgi:hypothetical protein